LYRRTLEARKAELKARPRFNRQGGYNRPRLPKQRKGLEVQEYAKCNLNLQLQSKQQPKQQPKQQQPKPSRPFGADAAPTRQRPRPQAGGRNNAKVPSAQQLRRASVQISFEAWRCVNIPGSKKHG
jgi:hypothetical protein